MGRETFTQMLSSVKLDWHM